MGRSIPSIRRRTILPPAVTLLAFGMTRRAVTVHVVTVVDLSFNVKCGGMDLVWRSCVLIACCRCWHGFRKKLLFRSFEKRFLELIYELP